MQKQITIQDILSGYGEQYIRDNPVSPQQKGIIRLLSACGTSLMGNHFQRCDNCGHTEVNNNSCRNRHCPSCQQKDKLQWLDKRMDELLPLGYYHLVFTLPHGLNSLCLVNKSLLYDILFKAVSQTLIELSRDTKHLGADIGLITMLHTWGQNMLQHPHLHCIMPAGGLSFDKKHWVHPCKKNDFFIHVKVLSRKFQGKFLDMLKQAYLHVLPKKFFKIRYYGILSNRYKRENISLAKRLLKQEERDKKQENREDGLTTWDKQDTVWNDILEMIRGFSRPNCPQCKKGHMCYYKPIFKRYHVIEELNQAPG